MIVWITGASSGIGYETARQYVAAGHRVFATARSSDKLAALDEDCRMLEGQLLWRSADVCDRAAMDDSYQALVDTFGMPDTVIFNAGTHWPTPAASFDLEAHRAMMDINYMGVLNSLDVVLQDFRQRGRGQIAIVASLAGYRGLPNASAYGASKAALINFTESIRVELARDGLDIRLVNPGFVKTPLTDLNDFDMPFLMPVEDAASRMIKGLAGKGFEITFPTRFALLMKLFRILPDGLFFGLNRRMVR